VTFVIDASLAIRILTNRKADHQLRQHLSSLRHVHAPHLLDAEVASGIRGLLLGGEISVERAAEMASDYGRLRIVRQMMAPLLPRVLALRHNVTAYDACYVALAEALQMPLWTLDGKLAGAVGHGAQIRLYRARETL
jgi:predicted nucleic acid-binding protein